MNISKWRPIVGEAAIKFIEQTGRILGVTLVRSGHAVEVLERQYLQRFLRAFRVDCVFDIGANKGQYAARLRACGFSGSIISCEPIPELAESLRRLAKKDPDWFIEEIALDKVAGLKSFNIMKMSEFSSFHKPTMVNDATYEEHNVVSSVIDVKTGRLDEVLLTYQTRLGFKRPFLKMDTQGHDIAVAEGAGIDLKKFIGIQSELSIKKLYAETPDYREVLDYFKNAGFEISMFVPSSYQFPFLLEFDCILGNTALINKNPTHQ